MNRNFLQRIDWLLLMAVVPIVGVGLVTMASFDQDNSLLVRQLFAFAVSLGACFGLSFFDFRFLRRTDSIVFLYLGSTALLLVLFVLGHATHGAQSWFRLGGFSFQPSDVAKLALILILAKYFSRRHVAIANFKHLFISGLYMLVPFLLVFFQPDFGSAIIIFLIWFGMVLVSGISKRHLLLVGMLGLTVFSCLWFFVFKPYQKERILNFIHPYADLSGSGYNAYQSTIAVGSGQFFGKGVGYGTQSRLQFLPEHETDFIFAAFAEEWGFVGVLLVLSLYTIVLWRILGNAMRGAANFEVLYGLGVAIYFGSHILINIGMNIGLLPVTGITLPFMSYGGSHLLVEFMALGILFGMREYRRVIHRDDLGREFVGMEHGG